MEDGPITEEESTHSANSLASVSDHELLEQTYRRSEREVAHGQQLLLALSQRLPLDHSQRLLLALSQAAQAVQRARTPQEVYRTVGDEIAGLGFNGVIFTLSEDRARLVLSHLTFAPALVKRAEALTGLTAQDYVIPIVEGSLHHQVAIRRETMYVNYKTTPPVEALPELARPLASQLVAVLGPDQAIYAPLSIGGEPHGMLAVIGAGLTKADMPAMTIFANQASIAIENARLSAQQRHRVTQMALLGQTALDIASHLDMSPLLRSIIERAARLLDATGGVIHLYDLLEEELEIVASQGLTVDYTGTKLGLGEGVAGKVVQSGDPVIVNDYAAWTEKAQPLTDTPSYAVIGVPIKWQNQVTGVLNIIDQSGTKVFDEDDVWLLSRFADQAAIAIENARLFQQAQQEIAERRRVEETLLRRNQELAMLNRASHALSATLDLDQVLVTVLDEVRRLLGVTACSVWLRDGPDDGLVCHQATGSFGSTVRGWRLAPGEGIAGWVAQTGESVIVPDTLADQRHYRDVEEEIGLTLRSNLTVPLQVRDSVIGVLQVVDVDAHRFSQSDLALIESLAASASIAIENAQLHQQAIDHAKELEQRVRARTSELQAQYARLDAILNSTSDGIVVTDANGKVLEANPVARTWLARSLSENDTARLLDTIQSLALRADQRPETVLELSGVDLELTAAPISDLAEHEVPAETIRLGLEQPQGKPAAVVDIHDVSYLKTLDRMKAVFVANASDELRHPVTTIKSYAYLVQRTPPEHERWSQYLDALVQEANEQAELVEDVMQVSRIYTGKLKLNLRPTPVEELVQPVVAGRQELAQQRGVALEYRSGISDSATHLVARVDPVQMTQVLNYLVSDAIRCTPEGGQVMVSTGLEETESQTWATVIVSDTGETIPEEDLPQVFERFLREEEPRSMRVSETGLRLMIVKGVVELHGGRVKAESPSNAFGPSGEEAGSTFRIWLPVDVA